MLTKVKIKLLALYLFLPVLVFGITKKDAMSITPMNRDMTSFSVILKTVLSGIFTISVPVMVLAIIYVGFLFVKAQGDPQELEKAKNGLTNVLIGVFLVAIFYTLFNIYYHD